jgi:aminopeptidase N
MAAVTILRADYLPPAYLIDHLALALDLAEAETAVEAELSLRPNPAAKAGQPLVLDGVGLTTLAVLLDGAELAPEAFRIDGDKLTLAAPPARPFRLTTKVTINPSANTALSGLYASAGMLCTQCEAEGFRRITWSLDRPDVMARFRVTLTADKARFPVLLSNGNLVESGDLPEGRHRAVWDDPFPKPSYLFAAVAGDLALVEGSFTTASGRPVALRFWVEHGARDQVPHALASLQKAMKWDEEVYGLEYDLDVFNVVAVSHFNMGAMENKSLNVFNSRYVLAKVDSATDGDFLGVEAVIAHEYFHNWTGNRVTCRDWFQLTLKEGLTVFRDHKFSGDMNSKALNRVWEVQGLRAGQFPEDASPMAHPIRPDSYQEINNFYTATVYQKGSEVIRMIETLIGPAKFRQGMDLYFQRHDGQAVTCEDFVAAMEDASGVDLKQFRRWYSQAGTPRVKASWRHDPATATLTLDLEQRTAPTPGQPVKEPFHIPVSLGLLGADGADLPLRLQGENAPGATTRVLSLTEPRQSFVFADVTTPALPSLFRGFSAPVVIEADYDSAQLAFRMAHDSDAFGRFDAGQQSAARLLLEMTAKPETTPPEAFLAAWGKVLSGAATDPAFAATALGLPSQGVLGEMMETIDVDGLYRARKSLYRRLAERFTAELTALHDQPQPADDDLSPAAIGQRSLRNLALALLAELPGSDALSRAQAQFAAARGMTNQIAALNALITLGTEAATPALDAFYAQWKGDGLVVNKWLGLQALADWPDALDRVRALMSHPAFDPGEPNKIYALIGGFSGNIRGFHRADGSGYAFIADQVLDIDGRNPQVAARLVRSLIRWRRYDPTRQALMRAQLERLAGAPKLSRDVAEIVGKALEG